MTGIDQLENLPLSQLFSGPLVAAIDASVQTQTETVNLLFDAGYDDDGNLITVVFNYTAPEPDPESGEYRREEQQLEIPLLLFLSPPNLQISRIEQKFSAQITDVKETSRSSSPNRVSSPFRLKVKPASQSVEYDRKRRSKFDLDIQMVAQIESESTGMELLERAVNSDTLEGSEHQQTRSERENRERITPERSPGESE